MYFSSIYLWTAIWLSPGGSSTVHIYTQTIHRTIQNNNTYNNTTILEECGPCPVLASYTLAFALQPRKKHGKTSVRLAASKKLLEPFTCFTFLECEKRHCNFASFWSCGHLVACFLSCLGCTPEGRAGAVYRVVTRRTKVLRCSARLSQKKCISLLQNSP